MDLDKIISDYVEKQPTDFAIMVNGDWGSGKTYYWHNVLAPLIESKIFQKAKATQKKSGFFQKDTPAQELDIKYEPIYISLYGISDINQLDSKIFAELHTFWKSKAVKVGLNFITPFISKIVNVKDFNSRDFIKTFDIDKKIVFCFDDLERLKGGILNEVFGYINLLAEHNNNKVLILCNETEISKNIDNYNRVKEKLIRFTYNFNPTVASIFPTIANNYSGEYKTFLDSKNELICGIYEKAEHSNLRTLKFNLDILEKIFYAFTEFEGEHKKYQNEILDRFILFITTYCIEYKIEQEMENLEQLERLSNNGAYNIANIDWSSLLQGDQNKEIDKNEKEDYVKVFQKKYLPFKDIFYDYYDCIAIYIHVGTLDIETFHAAIKNIEESLKVNEIKLEIELGRKLINFKVLKDEELEPIIREILEKVKLGIYTLSNYCEILGILTVIENNKLNDFKIDDSIIETFKKGIDLSKVHSKYIENLSFIIAENRNHDKYQAIRAYVLAANSGLKDVTNRAKADELVSLMKQNKIDEFSKILTDSNIQFQPIFCFIDFKLFFELTLALSNSDKIYLIEALRRRYAYTNAMDSTVKEIPFFAEYLKLIKAHLAGGTKREISDLNLEQIAQIINYIINLPTEIIYTGK